MHIGGIPVVFPQFGPSLFTSSSVQQQWESNGHHDSKLGQHGFARTSIWEYVDSSVHKPTGMMKVITVYIL